MRRFTLDTCCIVQAAQGGAYQGEVRELVELAQQGVIEVWYTSGFDGDQRDNHDADRLETNRRWLWTTR